MSHLLAAYCQWQRLLDLLVAELEVQVLYHLFTKHRAPTAILARFMISAILQISDGVRH